MGEIVGLIVIGIYAAMVKRVMDDRKKDAAETEAFASAIDHTIRRAQTVVPANEPGFTDELGKVFGQQRRTPDGEPKDEP